MLFILFGVEVRFRSGESKKEREREKNRGGEAANWLR
jgi:hypothetical protein